MPPTGRSIRQIGLPVRDLDRALDFYRDVLGLRFVERFGPLAFFGLDGIRLMLEEGESDEAPVASVLYLGSDDIAGDRSDLIARGVEFADEPHCIFVDAHGVFGHRGDEEWLTFFTDPDGNVLALSSRRTPEA